MLSNLAFNGFILFMSVMEKIINNVTNEKKLSKNQSLSTCIYFHYLFLCLIFKLIKKN